MFLRAVGATIAALLLAASPARGEEPRVAALSWTRMPGAEQCATPRDVARGVEDRLGRRVFVSPAAAELFVEGRVERAETGWRVVITLSEADGTVLGTREIDGADEDCRAIDPSAVLVLSAMIDPEAALRAAAAPETESSEANAEPEPVETARTLEPPPPDCPEPPASAPSWRVGLHAGGVAGLGMLPELAPGATMHVDVTPPGFVPIELGATLFRTATAGLRDGGGADLSLAWGEAALCPELWSADGAWVRGCGGVQVGTVHSRGFGFDRSFDTEDVVASALLRARTGLRVAGPLTVSLGATLGVPVLRQTFEARAASGETREVFRMTAVTGLLEVGLGGDFF